MHDQLPNHLAMPEVDKLVDLFASDHELTGKVEHSLSQETLLEIEEAMGEVAVEHVVEADDDASWWKLASLSEHHRVYSNENASVRRIPVSLPLRDNGEFTTGAVQYASGEEMGALLEQYGVDESVVETARADGWNVPVEKLPQELRVTINKANVFEAMSRSHDLAERKRATERNSEVTVEDIWQSSTLHHVTNPDRLQSILKDGQLGYMLEDEKVVNTGGANTGTVNFGAPFAEVAIGADSREHMQSLAYNDRGKVYIHYLRPEGCFREGEEFAEIQSTILMSGGMPSTEISAFMLRNIGDVETLETSWKAVNESGMYVPIFDADGTLLFSREQFDAGAIPDAVQVKLNYERQSEMAQLRREKDRQDTLAREAAAAAMTIDDYVKQKSSQPPVRPPM